MNYNEKLAEAVTRSGSVLCIGLDPSEENIPHEITASTTSTVEAAFEFCRQTIEITADTTAAYKLNSAYFEAFGAEGFQAMATLRDQLPGHVISVADAKRGDVPHTAERYKVAFFDRLGFDAITLSPLPGTDSILPYLTDPSKGCYILALTSNPGASDFFLQKVEDGITLSEYITRKMARLSRNVQSTLGLVIGATQYQYSENLLEEFAGGHLLMPGIGAQNANPDQLINLVSRHSCKPLIPVSRGIMKAHSNSDVDWKTAVSSSAREYNQMFKTFAKLHG